MYKGLVKIRPFEKKKKRKIWWENTGSKKHFSLKKIPFEITNRTKRIFMRSLVGIILFFAGFYFFFQNHFLRKEFYIQQIQFSESSINLYEDIELFDFISKELKGKNYYEFQYFLQGEILKKAQQITPFVKSIDYQFQTWNTLWIDITFQDPLFRIKMGDLMFGVRDDNTNIVLLSWMSLGKDTFILHTPQYLSWTTTLDGFFYKIPVKKLLSMIDFVQTEIPTFKSLVYFAGSTNFLLYTTDNKEIYFNFNNEENLKTQFNKYHLLETYYPLDTVQVIDLWALDETKIIIRKRT